MKQDYHVKKRRETRVPLLKTITMLSCFLGGILCHLSHLLGMHPRPAKTHATIASWAGDRQLFLRTEESIPALLSATQELQYYCRQIVRIDKRKTHKAPNHMN
jgi:hypothetical protein